MSFNRFMSKTSLFQTSTNAAATLAASGIDDLDAFRAIRDELYSDLLAIQQAEIDAEADEAGEKPKATASNGAGSPGAVVLNFGAHKGKTIAEVYSEKPGYVKDFLTKSRNEFIAAKATAFVAALG